MAQTLKGITLLETMLVLAIGTSIALLGVRQYIQYKFDRDAFALRYNVDILLQAMRDYYYAHCADNTTLAPDPTENYVPNDPFAIVSIKVQLGTFFKNEWRPTNPLLDSTFAEAGYIAQFNKVTPSTKRNENFCYYFPNTGQVTPNCASLINNSADIYLWVAQVVVKVKNPALTIALKGLTGADCAIEEYSNSLAVDCSTEVSAVNPTYLVWQRLPSFISPKINSSAWGTLPTVKQFNLQYTNDSFGELTSATYAGSQYYLCGG